MNKVLALEFSTAQASLALLAAGEVIATRAVAATHRRSQELFAAADELLAGASWHLREMDAFAVGCGPGAYTGLRVSLTTANGWALPTGRPVWTVASAAALAAETLAEDTSLAQVVVAGEARRGTIWAGLFARDPAHLVAQIGDWQLLPAAARGTGWPGVPWVAAGRVPHAAWVGRLHATGRPSAAPEPIYLHPAVAIPPRFPTPPPTA